MFDENFESHFSHKYLLIYDESVKNWSLILYRENSFIDKKQLTSCATFDDFYTALSSITSALDWPKCKIKRHTRPPAEVNYLSSFLLSLKLRIFWLHLSYRTDEKLNKKKYQNWHFETKLLRKFAPLPSENCFWKGQAYAHNQIPLFIK